MEPKIAGQLKELEEKIRTWDIKEAAQGTEEWGGADVVIAAEANESIRDWIDNQPLVISCQRFAPRRRLVLTPFSRELSWLFFQLKAIFCDQLDYIVKYDFYGSLAQAALDHLHENGEQAQLAPLLLAVLDTAKRFEF